MQARNESTFDLFCSLTLHNDGVRLNSVSLIAAGLDVEEFADEVNLNAGGDDDDEDLHERPGAYVAVVLSEQRVVSRLNCSGMCLELVPEKKEFKSSQDRPWQSLTAQKSLRLTSGSNFPPPFEWLE